MKIRYLFFSLLTILPFQKSKAQAVVEQLKRFYKKADVNCYLAKIEKNVNDYFVLENKNWGRDKNGIPPDKVDLHDNKIVYYRYGNGGKLSHKDEYKVVPMLTVQFVDTESLKEKEDIYKHITIDSSIIFTLACVDDKMKTMAFANFYGGTFGYLDLEQGFNRKGSLNIPNLKQVINNINKHNPELILYSQALATHSNGVTGTSDSNGFMFIKNGKIYVFRVNERDVYELNDFINKFFTLNRIRDLNEASVPLIYQKGELTRRTGNTPEMEKLSCPEVSR
ncbi:hypothetical protein LQ567_16870 [Niabella pedocola]|uniref:Phosphodiester glycosidase domain-containing protein n=1 Tax=Niabella pedocola TaxID=1752077 RepID=A0ABS8PTQ1_9BACT|nr:hypothetical protein [Niabella pedocola]MCD2424455.1 hypothetical protein [Niabella pedocola]